MHSRSFPIVILTVLAAVAGMLAAFAPEPDPIPRRWQFAVEPGPLRVASVDDGKGAARAFYFLTYKVTNTTDQDLLFTPIFELGTDEGELLRSGRDVPGAVTKEILARLNNPFIEDQINIVGPLLQGDANAREGVVIWPVTDLHVGEITIYASGFSGETKSVEYKNAKGEVEKAILRKTLMLRFQPGGELSRQNDRPIELVTKQWIMR